MSNIKYNDVPVFFRLQFVTEPGEGWKGSEFLGVYGTIEDLNLAISDYKDKIPEYWQFKIDFVDADAP